MSRRLLLASGVVVLAAGGLGYVGYDRYFASTPSPPPPVFTDAGEALSTQQQFDKLAATDPVKLLSECLTRYQREAKDGRRTGLRCELQKQERVQGKPPHPEMPPVEVIELNVRGDVPDADNKTAIEVLMRWKSGAKKFLGSDIAATLFSERPKSSGGLDGKLATWRPKALFSAESAPVAPNTELAKGQSRYCIRDAGLYRSMLRTHAAWKARQDAGELTFEYLGKRTPEHIGRECHVIKRVCPRPEIDAFEIGGVAPSDPKVAAAEGFTEVTIFVDVERWVQVGTELYRAEPDGTRVLVGAYHFRDVQLTPTFPPDTFTPAGMKK